MNVNEFINTLGADFYTGVPDSLLSVLCDSLIGEYGDDMKHHVIAANEGNAVALAAGYHLATGKTGVVYMQNSGEGNTVNPICSLLHPDVYGIPCLFVIGWRGEPGIKDEPQHVFQGKVTFEQMKLLDIETFALNADTTSDELRSAVEHFHELFKKGKSAAIVVSKGALTSEHKFTPEKSQYSLKREQALEIILKHIPEDTVIVSTTGKTSRELFELREKLAVLDGEDINADLEKKLQCHKHDFLTVGSMGHASSIALGIALHKPQSKIICIDGDGALLMHMGAMATIGNSNIENLIHIAVNNEAHESVGGFKTAAVKTDYALIAKACGYKTVLSANSEQELVGILEDIKLKNKENLPVFIEIKCAQGARKELGRPTVSAKENKENFMKMLNEHLS